MLVGSVPSKLDDVCNIVGASKLPNYETMFLFHFYKWTKHDDEYRWMTQSEAGNIGSLTDATEAGKLVGETLHVYWTDRGASGKPYQGRIAEFDEHQMAHRIEYEDEDCEYLNLSTLKASAVQDETPPEYQRETWMLDGEYF